MNNVVITNYLRSAQSRSRPTLPERDWLAPLRGDVLLAQLIPSLLTQAKINSAEIDDLIIGSALGVSEQWTFGGRTIAMLANLDPSVPTRFVDQQCGGGMAAIQIGFMEIASGFANIVLACGMEHMTRVPIGPSLFENGTMSVNKALYKAPEYAHWDMETIMNMGFTAEKLAEQSGITRKEMDLWTVRSHQRATQAAESGFFSGEIMPIAVKQGNGEIRTVNSDQAIRPDTDIESTGNLKPAFREGGSITAGNSSPLSAGAGTMLLMSEKTASDKKIKPLARIRSIGFSGVDPTLMGLGPIPSTKMALDKAGLHVDDIDYWEINEAFSVVVLNTIKELGIDPEKVNIHGGSIALGHPLGATGIRLLGTLARILAEKEGSLGCATACIGGGQGIALIVERLN